MPDLCVPTTDLQIAGANLHTVVDEFDDAEQISDDNRHLVGHSELAKRLDEFASNWSIRRNEMLESIDQLAEVATVTGETFEELEDEFVACLRDGAA